MKNMFVFSLLLFFFSCQKEELPKPAPPVTPTAESKIKIRWQTLVHPDTLEGYCVPHAVVDGDPVFSTSYLGPSYLTSLKRGTGDVKWKFDQFTSVISGMGEYDAISTQDAVIVNDWDHLYSINPTNGQLNWTNDAELAGGGGSPRMEIIANDIYKVYYEGGPPTTLSQSLIRADSRTGQYDTVFTIVSAGDGYFDFINVPAQWINPSGDTVLIVSVSEPYVSATPRPEGYSLTRATLYAWNTRTKQFDWQIHDFNKKGGVCQRPCLIDGNYAYLTGTSTFYCFDLVSGTIKWQRAMPEAISLTQPVMHEGSVIIKSIFTRMWAMDKLTGNIVWEKNDIDGQAYRLEYFEGVVYFTGQGASTLYAINADTGEKIWAERTPSRKVYKTREATWGDATIVIDRVNRVLYTADRYYFMALELAVK